MRGSGRGRTVFEVDRFSGCLLPGVDHPGRNGEKMFMSCHRRRSHIIRACIQYFVLGDSSNLPDLTSSQLLREPLLPPLRTKKKILEHTRLREDLLHLLSPS